MKNFCNRLSAEGWVACAPDLYGGHVAKTIDEARQLSGALESKTAQQTIIAASEWLRAHKAVAGPNYAVVGFSLGAFFASWLSRNRPQGLAAVTFFYGTGAGNYAKTQAAFLAHFAETDPYVSQTLVKKLQGRLLAAKRPHEIHIYPGTHHWFMETDRPEYNAKAAKIAWARTVKFLKANLK